MTVTQYTSEPFTYPGGAVAAGVLVRVLHRGTNVLAPIFRNASGVRAANPLRTDGAGQITFYIEPGDYTLSANGVESDFAVAAAPPGASNVVVTFPWNQSTPAATWTIPHPLNTKPAVDVYILGVRTYVRHECPDDNTVVITWPVATAGFAYLRG